ncbi:hypothetical protein [Aeromonas veronii]|uniref:hypothetical protein n=1 Tax=Aeromonas veronii TaxID=654 RepID=UPI00244444F8|nr:hypothetical protein [Aeromonas veronii]
MFKELSKSLKASLYERASSPLIGAIAISWVGFNWKAILYMLLSESKIEDKLSYFGEHYSDLNTNLIHPVLIGSAASILYPFFAFVPFYVWEKVQHAQINIKQRLSMSQLLTVEQSLQLREEISEKDKQLRVIIDENQKSKLELNKTIKQLSDENKDLYFKLSELTPPDPKADPSKINLPPVQYDILNKHTGLADGHVQIASDIAESLNLSLSEVEKALEELERAGFIQQEADVTDDNGNDVPGYTLDELGRKYLGYKKSQLAA